MKRQGDTTEQLRLLTLGPGEAEGSWKRPKQEPTPTGRSRFHALEVNGRGIMGGRVELLPAGAYDAHVRILGPRHE
jgi:hypothetical protein